MQLLKTFLATILATTALAAPRPASETKSMLAGDNLWTVKDFTRWCSDDNVFCSYSFSIDLNDGSAPTSCDYDVRATSTATAAEASVRGIKCGAFVLQSNWSDQFGPGKGFTTWGIVKTDSKLIFYPSFEDNVLVNDVKVTPDRSYPPSVFTGDVS